MNITTIFQTKRNKILALMGVVLLLLGIILISNRLRESKPAQVTAPRIANVKITEDGLEPQLILVKKGTVVIWTNVDSEPHKIASGPFPTHSKLKELNSLYNIDVNGTYRFSFDKIGEYTYQDDLRPELQGTVVVE